MSFIIALPIRFWFGFVSFSVSQNVFPLAVVAFLVSVRVNLLEFFLDSLTAFWSGRQECHLYLFHSFAFNGSSLQII